VNHGRSLDGDGNSTGRALDFDLIDPLMGDAHRFPSLRRVLAVYLIVQ
jgi:hypothetical protein